MSQRILWINPIGIDVFDASLGESLRANAGPGVEVDVMSFPNGPWHLEYHYYGALMLPSVLKTVSMAEKRGYDGAVIGCFFDPGLREAREITTRMAVTAPEEAALHIASTLGDRFSVIVTREKCIPAMRENALRYGFADKVASFKPLNLGVHDLHRDEKATMARLTECAREAVDKDRADVVVLGCSVIYGVYQELQQVLGVPVIDAVLAPLKYLQFLIEIQQRFGWGHSKRIGYESPPPEEIRRWGLEEGL